MTCNDRRGLTPRPAGQPPLVAGDATHRGPCRARGRAPCGVSSTAGVPRMVPSSRAPYQVGIALDQDRVAVLAEADCFAVAQAQQVVIARLLRYGPWPAV